VDLFLGIFWLFIPLGFKAAPSFVRKMAWLIPAYLVVIMFYAIWFEVRLLMPLYPVLIPIGLAYLFPSEPYKPVLKHPCTFLTLSSSVAR
jgi:hypothetical protein